MQRLTELARPPMGVKLMQLEALAVVAGVRLSLWILRFRRVRQLPQLLARRTVQPRRATERQVALTVSVASRYVPHATCLTQALATQIMLSWRGQATELRLGVARGTRGAFEAHAWIESCGRVVIGGSAESLAHYAVLPLESIR